MKKNSLIFICLLLGLAALCLLDLEKGSTKVGMSALWETGVSHKIMIGLRLPKMVTAVLAGAALSMSGLQMQTLFRNALAGPSVLGVTSGATLGVALLVMAGTLAGFTTTASLTALFAVTGAMLILLLVMAVSARIQNNVTLLIVGMMVGSIATALVNVMQNFADPDSLKLFVTWTLGSLAGVSWHEMIWLASITGAGIILGVALIKPLNGLLLGEDYARSLGINVRLIRTLLIVSTGLMAGGITAYCGPIAFIGVAIPHLARGIFKTSNHRITMPACAIIGADILLICDILSSLTKYPLPISTVSALFGAPIVIWVIVRKRN